MDTFMTKTYFYFPSKMLQTFFIIIDLIKKIYNNSFFILMYC